MPAARARRDRAPLPRLGGAARARPCHRHFELRRHRRNRAHLGRRDRDARLGPALDLRAGAQSRVLRLCRGARLPARAHTLVGGMCETDFSGYPDCRDATLRALRAGDQARHRNSLHHRDAADVAAPRPRPGRSPNGSAARRSSISSSRRPTPAIAASADERHDLGLWLRHLPGLRASRQGLCRMAGFARGSHGFRLKKSLSISQSSER